MQQNEQKSTINAYLKDLEANPNQQSVGSN